jgi:Integrase core domain
VLEQRRLERRGPDRIGPQVGVPARTVTRVLRRHQVPRLAECDPLTGEPIRASKSTAVRHERKRPGELVHMDVKKIGKIPDGGGWRAHGRAMGSTGVKKRARIGYDYMHSLVDDHSRLAYSEILPNEQGATCAGFLARAAAYFAAQGIARIERVMTDNHWSYTRSSDVAKVIAQFGRQTQADQATLPMAKRQGRTPQPHPARRMGLPPRLHHQHRPQRGPCTLARALQHSASTHRTRRPTTSQPTVTNLMAGYS